MLLRCFHTCLGAHHAPVGLPCKVRYRARYTARYRARYTQLCPTCMEFGASCGRCIELGCGGWVSTCTIIDMSMRLHLRAASCICLCASSICLCACTLLAKSIHPELHRSMSMHLHLQVRSVVNKRKSAKVSEWRRRT